MDTAPEGDMAWKGVNMRLHPALLGAGWLSNGRNIRCTDGKPKPRKGLQILPWTNLASSVATVPEAITAFQGAGVFADPDDNKWIIYAANGATYYCGPHTAARPIALPAGVSIAGETVEFVQCLDRLIMLRGTASNPLQLRSVTDAWEEIAQLTNAPEFSAENPSDGTETIPPAEWGMALQNRLLLPNTTIGEDVFSISDYFNYTRYQPVLSSFRINQGDEEAIVGAFEVPTPEDVPSSAILVFKENSIYIVSGIIGNLSDLALQTVTKEYSVANRHAVWRVGRDVWFVAAGRGVSSLAQTDQNKWQGVDVPVSLDIQPLIERLDWAHKSRIRGAKVGNFSYIAAPLDGGRFEGGNLIPGTASYAVGLYTITGLVVGQTYHYTPGNALHAAHAGGSLDTEQDWVATQTTLLLEGNEPGAVTATIQLVYTGVNNAILVYDHLNQAWAGYDTGVSVAQFLPFTYQGVERLFVFTTDGWFGLYEELAAGDNTNGYTESPIDFSATTRGYAMRSQLGRIRAKEIRLQLKTWGPRYSVSATMDGANETESIATQETKSRTRYTRPHTRAPWTASNVNNDHGTAFREDYSVDLSSAVHITSLHLDLYQESTETYRCPKGTRGQYVTFDISNDRGRCELHGVMIETVKVDRKNGSKV